MLCWAKEDTVDSCALRTVYPNPGGFDEEFYNNDSKWGQDKDVSRSCTALISTQVQFSSVAQSCLTLCNPTNRSRPPCLSPTPGVHPNPCPLSQWCHLILLFSVGPFSSCPQSFPASGSFQSLHIRWPKYWSFSFNISPSNEHPGLISFRMDWLDLLAAQGTLKSLLQHHSSKASIFQHSAFFMVNSYMHTWPNCINLKFWKQIMLKRKK